MLQYSSMIFFTLKFSYLLPHLSLFFRLLLLIHVLGEAVERSETDERDGIGLCPVLTEAVRTLSRSPHPPPSGAPSPRGRLRAAEGASRMPRPTWLPPGGSCHGASRDGGGLTAPSVWPSASHLALRAHAVRPYMAAGAHPRVASPGLRPIHLQPPPYTVRFCGT